MKIPIGMLSTIMILFVSPHISLARYAMKSAKIELLTEADMPAFSTAENLYVEGCLQAAHNEVLSVDDYKIDIVKAVGEIDEPVDLSDIGVLDEEDENDDMDDYDDDIDVFDDDDTNDDWRRNRKLWRSRFSKLYFPRNHRSGLQKWLDGLRKAIRESKQLTYQSRYQATSGRCENCPADDGDDDGYFRRLKHEETNAASEHFCKCIMKSPFDSFDMIYACGLSFDNVMPVYGEV